MDDSTTPSNAQLTWIERIRNRNSGLEAGAPWWVNDKYKLHNFCAQHNLPTPRVYGFWRSPDEIDFDTLPDSFVLKPTVMFSMWGVMLLERRHDGTFYEGLKRRIVTEDEIRAEQAMAYEKCKFKNDFRIMAEERIMGPAGRPIPLDYKVAVFYDTPRQVLQIDRNPPVTHYAFFDGDFEPLELTDRIVSDWSTKGQGQHLRPSSYKEMLNIAVDVTRKIATPFMRVDMFVGAHGPVIGELTPSPGDAFYGNNYTFSEAYDAELGREWLLAEERIARESSAHEGN